MARPNPAGARVRHEARLRKGEKSVERAVLKSLMRLTAYAKTALAESGLNPDVLDSSAKPWRDALTGDVTPALMAVYQAGWDAIAAGSTDLDPGPYATRHLESVWNRMVGVSDQVFDSIRVELEAGRQAGDSIAVMSKRVDALLTDEQRWKGRATTVARTEVIAANNAGAHQAATVVASSLGVHPGDVQRTWLATEDDRTRETHAEADGQVIYGMDATYEVGDSELAYPGDPSGDPGETINCRCTETYAYPGDPDYAGDAIAASARRQEHPMTRLTARYALTAAAGENDPTGVVVVALPAADDPCQGVGPEEKHATLLYLGDVPGSTGDTINAALTADFKAALIAAVTATADATAPFTEAVDGVESLGDDGARVWMLAGDTLPGVRSDLIAADTDVQPALDGVTQFPTYTPHVTIGYPADAPADAEAETDDDAPDAADTAEGAPVDTSLLDPAIETAAADVTTIRFDRLAIWWAGEQTEHTLNGTDTTEEPAVAASARHAAVLAAIASARTVGEAREKVAAILAAAGDPAPTPAPADEMAAGDPAPPLDQAEAAEAPEVEAGEDRFWGVCMMEDSQTGDGRVFAPGSVVWGDLPMPFGWQPQDAPGHEDAIVCGRIDTLARVGNFITYTGTWDLDGAGWEVRRLVDGQFVNGLSVDVDDCEVALLLPDGTQADPFDLMFPPDGDADDPILTVMHGRIRSAVACRVPAMEGAQAFIANGLPVGDGTQKPMGMPAPDDTEAEPAIAASLVAAAAYVPTHHDLPDPSVFADPGLEAPTPLTVTADGRVYGHLAEWGVCHIGIDGVCTEPPVSMSDYAYFAVGSVLCADGSQVHVGQITMDTGHASLSMGARPAAAHYDDTGTAVADIAVGQDGIGIWMAGRVRPGTPQHKIDELRATGKVSGDWREVRRGSGELELVAALAVNVPGFPIPRIGLGLAASGAQTSLVASGIVASRADVLYRHGQTEATLDGIDLRALIREELRAERRPSLAAAANARLRARAARRAAARLEV